MKTRQAADREGPEQRPKATVQMYLLYGLHVHVPQIHMLKPYSPGWLYLEKGPLRKELRLNESRAPV